MNPMPRISVIIPISGLSGDFAVLNDDYLRVLSRLDEPYEVIYVVDVDDPAIRSIVADQVSRHPFAKSVTLPRPYNDSTALKAGLRAAFGDRVLQLPAHPQVEPQDVLAVLAALDHCDLAIGQRDRTGESLLNRIHGVAFNFLLSKVGGSRVSDMGCEVRAFTRNLADEVWFYGDQHQFLPVLAERMGFSVKSVGVRQTKDNRRRTLRPVYTYFGFVLDILNLVFLTRFTKRPLRFFGGVGLALAAVGAAIIAYVVMERLLFDIDLASRPALIMGGLLLVVGLQILGIGLIGEIVVFSRARDLPEYYVKEVISGYDAIAALQSGGAQADPVVHDLEQSAAASSLSTV
jgi:glycosyltransferase involved in cell wall biosynthesis